MVGSVYMRYGGRAMGRGTPVSGALRQCGTIPLRDINGSWADS